MNLFVVGTHCLLQIPMNGFILKTADTFSNESSWTSVLRINLTYLARHGRLPNLASPKTFTELVQVRKLKDRNPVFPILADKVAVKSIVSESLGSEWVTPTLWSGDELPERPLWPAPFVIKSRHGCNQFAIMQSDNEDWSKIRKTADAWASKTYGYWLDEWLYKDIPHGILVEPFIGRGKSLPIDYKFYVFNGEAVFIQVHLGRGGDHRWILLDRDWCRVSADTNDDDPKPPQSLNAMLAAAETLGSGMDFVRVDLYEPNGSPVFGEMTFYPGSGLDPFNPVGLDKVIGAEWLKAIHAMKRKSGLLGRAVTPIEETYSKPARV